MERGPWKMNSPEMEVDLPGYRKLSAWSLIPLFDFLFP